MKAAFKKDAAFLCGGRTLSEEFIAVYLAALKFTTSYERFIN